MTQRKKNTSREKVLRMKELTQFLEEQKAKGRLTTSSTSFAVGPYDDEFWGLPEQNTPTDPDLEGPSFDAFIGEIKNLFGKSERKGYGPRTPDSPNPLYEFMRTFFSDDHALGEIVYKAIRFKNKRDPEDLVKIAGWAWLVFMHHWKDEAANE